MGSEQLSGTGKERILRVRVGDYRVLYQVFDARLIVLVVRVADRRDAYGTVAMQRLIDRIRAGR
jgi:mRNA-degrading endonuclease RelE of RelBE toxin-antitoxin system